MVLLRRGLCRLFIGFCSRTIPFGSFCGATQRPGQRPRASFGQPAQPDHGPWALRSVASGAPPWPPGTFARRLATVSWEGSYPPGGAGPSHA